MMILYRSGVCTNKELNDLINNEIVFELLYEISWLMLACFQLFNERSSLMLALKQYFANECDLKIDH